MSDLDEVGDWSGKGYSYVWPFSAEPRVGDWAVAPGLDGLTPVVVVGLGRSESSRGMTLKSLVRQIPRSEVERAQAPARERARRYWERVERYLVYARAQALLEPARVEPPTGREFPRLVPPSGEASVSEAGGYASAWSSAVSLARDAGWSEAERQVLVDARSYWGRLFNRLSKVQQDEAMARLLGRVDVDEVARDLGRRSPEQVKGMRLAGKELWTWLDVVKALEKEGRGSEALRLVEALITAAEEHAALSGREPAPGYTERAAIMYRKRKDYEAEVRVLERWEAFCPPERRGPGALQSKLADRLVKARQLAQRNR